MISIRWILGTIARILLILSYFLKNNNKDYLTIIAISLLIINPWSYQISYKITPETKTKPLANRYEILSQCLFFNSTYLNKKHISVNLRLLLFFS